MLLYQRNGDTGILSAFFPWRVRVSLSRGVMESPSLSLDRAEGQAGHDVALDEKGHEDHGDDRDRGNRADLSPEQAPVDDETADQHGQGPYPERAQLDGKEELVPRRHESQEEDGNEAWCGEGNDDPSHEPAEAASIDVGRLDDLVGQLLEVSIGEPDDERQVEEDVGDDHAEVRVDQLQIDED